MKKNLSIATIFTFIMIVVMRWEGASLKTPTTPRAILDLEFADNAHRLNEVLSVWSVSVVKGNIWLDFLFIVSYVLFLSLSAEYSAMKWPSGIGRQAGLLMARAAYIAGVLDISENLLMLQSIAGHYTSLSLQLTYYCAAIKFVLAGLILLYVLLSLPIVLRQKK